MSTHRTDPDPEGYTVVVRESVSGDVVVTVEDHGGSEGGSAYVADRTALAAAILGWPVNEVTRADPARVVVERADVRVVTRPEHVSDAMFERADAALRAALGEDGAR